MKLFTSSTVGGSPVRSKQARLSRVNLSASGEKLTFFFAMAETKKESMGVRARSLDFVFGTGGLWIG